jgi:hypothetical protein
MTSGSRASHGIHHEARLVPEKRRIKVNGKVQHQQRLLLAPERIELRGFVTLSCIFKPVFVAKLEVSPNTEHPPMTTIRTSHSHPILVDWLSGIPEGRVGLTFAPDKHSTSVYVPDALWRRDLAMDLDELVRQGVTDLVCLLQDKDLKKLKISHLVPEATARGLQVHRLPIGSGRFWLPQGLGGAAGDGAAAPDGWRLGGHPLRGRQGPHGRRRRVAARSGHLGRVFLRALAVVSGSARCTAGSRAALAIHRAPSGTGRGELRAAVRSSYRRQKDSQPRCYQLRVSSVAPVQWVARFAERPS